MITRQQLISAGLAASVAPLAGCSMINSAGSYETAARKVWQPTAQPIRGKLALQRELMRYATLAPSGHNTQCWKFHIEQNSMLLLPDFSRHTPVVDPDDHHLFVSLGCVLENLAQASAAYGLQAQQKFDAGKNVLTVQLTQAAVLASPCSKPSPTGNAHAACMTAGL